MPDRKVAFITGAAQGIGMELARKLGALNYRIALSARNKEKGEAAAAELLAEGIDATFIPTDVSNEVSIHQASREVAKLYGKVDLLVNNAGVNARSTGNNQDFVERFKLDGLKSEALLDMMRVNAVGPILVAKHFQELLILGENPVVVNISSWLGSLSVKVSGGNYGYCGSKAALNMYTRSLAQDFLPLGITVILVNPGWVMTKMGGENAKLTTEESVSGIVKVIGNVTTDDAGKFLQWDGTEHPW
jgi:NAD(P)-dependent dehydrogenase (short-subunit alcohol dehydrogenase family)